MTKANSSLRCYAFGTPGPVTVGEPFDIGVRVEGQNVARGTVQIDWEPSESADLTIGSKSEELSAGNYARELIWTLVARAKGSTTFKVQARAGQHQQLVQISVKVD